jgi:hypothetical protein
MNVLDIKQHILKIQGKLTTIRLRHKFIYESKIYFNKIAFF